MTFICQNQYYMNSKLDDLETKTITDTDGINANFYHTSRGINISSNGITFSLIAASM